MPDLATNLNGPFFIGDNHSDLSRLAKLTATLSVLKGAGIRDIFLEAFYHQDTDVLKRELSIDDINQYLNNRNFVHPTSTTGLHNLPIFYAELLKRARQLQMRVHGIDSPMPSSIANLGPGQGKAFKVIKWRTGTANDEWKNVITSVMGQSKLYAIFGGQAHSKPLIKRIPELSVYTI